MDKHEVKTTLRRSQNNALLISLDSDEETNSTTGEEAASKQLAQNENEHQTISKQKLYLVELRAVLMKIGEIDSLNQKFMADAFIEVKWFDPDLSPDTKYNPEVNWNPKLYLLNSVGDLKQHVWYTHYSISDYKKIAGKISFGNEVNNNSHFYNSSRNQTKTGSVILERRRVCGQFWQTFNFQSFPADIQKLTISLTTQKHVSEVELTHCKLNPSTVNNQSFKNSQEWHLYRHIKVNEYLRDAEFSFETFSAVDLTIHAARNPTYYLLNIIFLNFLITLSSLAVFSMRCHLNPNRIQTECTLLLTSVTFKWATNRYLPTVSYMTQLDKYQMVCMLLLFGQIIWDAVISSMLSMDAKCVYPYSFYDLIAFGVFSLVFLVKTLAFLGWLMWHVFFKRSTLKREEIGYTLRMAVNRRRLSTRLNEMLHEI